MRIVVASPFATSTADSGAALRNFNLYRHVARRHEVEIVSLVHPHAGPFEGEIAPGLFERRIVTSAAHHAAEGEMSARVGDVPVTDLAMARLHSLTPEFGAALRRACERADLLVASHPYLAAALRVASTAPLAYEAPDVEVDLKESVLPRDAHGRELLSLVALAEADCCREAARVFACSDDDRERLVELYALDPGRIDVVPNGVDFGEIAFVDPEARAARRREGRAPIALFLASWHGPNNDAARWILALARSMPHVRFVIAGSTGAALGEVERPANVEITGFIDAQAKARWLREADVALNPVMAGAGTSLKMLEYLAAGLPVISTAVGARGLALRDGHELVVAGLEGFADAIDSVLDLRRQAAIGAMVRGARRWVERHGDWERIGAAMAESLEALRPVAGAADAERRRARLVSVLIPMRDAEPYIDECLHSVRSQTHDELEVLVVDDGSTDGSAAIVRRHACEDRRIRLLTHPGGGNRGVSHSLALALAHARGNRIALLDADDAFEPGKLARQMQAMDAHPEVTVCHTAATVVGPGEAWLVEHIRSHFGAFDSVGTYRLLERDDALSACRILNSTALIDARAMRAAPFAVPQWFQSEDWLLFTLLALEGPFFLYLPERTTRYRVHPGSYSSRVLSSPLGTLYAHLEFFLTLKARCRDPGVARRVDREIALRLDNAVALYAEGYRATVVPGLADAPAAVAATVSVRWLGVPHEDIARDAPLRVELSNRGQLTFASRWPHPVHLAYHWLDALTGEPVLWDGRRTAIAPALAPGETRAYPLHVDRPDWLAGRSLVLRATLVLENGFWFDQHAACFADWRFAARTPELAQ